MTTIMPAADASAFTGVNFYVHVETQSERLLRLSNFLAWVVELAWEAGSDNRYWDTMAEAADMLGRLSRVAQLMETLGNFDVASDIHMESR